MEANYQVKGAVMVYQMPREVDHHWAGNVGGEMDCMIENYGIRRLVLDFSETEFMDSSGIGLIIGRSRLIHFFQGEISVRHLSERLNKIFETSGLFKIVNLDLNEAKNEE